MPRDEVDVPEITESLCDDELLRWGKVRDDTNASPARLPTLIEETARMIDLAADSTIGVMEMGVSGAAMFGVDAPIVLRLKVSESILKSFYSKPVKIPYKALDY